MAQAASRAVLWDLKSKWRDQPSERVRETLWIVVEIGAVGRQRLREVVVVLGVLLLVEPTQRLL